MSDHRYIIVDEMHSVQVEAKVNYLIGQGYELAGGLLFKKAEKNYHIDHWVQAMYLPKKNDD